MSAAPKPNQTSLFTTLNAAARPGILGGLAGAILIDAYRLIVETLAHGSGEMERHYRRVAAAVIGSIAYAYPGAAYAGVAIHVIIAITWGVGYTYVALQSPRVAHRPIVSGFFFGVVVYISMAIISALSGIVVHMSPQSVFYELIAHTIFFGIPLALVVDARLRAAER
jgi:MFS family permease